MSARGVLLDVDNSILERNLKITKETPEEEYVNRLFPEVPYKLYKPFPGICLKMRLAQGKKLFVNVCILDILPEPADFKVEELNNEDFQFRVPMSIGDIHYSMDKSGEEATVIDIAINDKFFKKLTNNEELTVFLIELVKDSIHEKYKLEIDDEVRILKNRKCFGELQMHRIKKQEIDEKIKAEKDKTLLISEVIKENKKIQELADLGTNKLKPEYRCYKEKSPDYVITEKFTNYVITEVFLPKIRTSKDFTLDIGEDRVVLESETGNYFLDFFTKFSIDPDETSAQFDVHSKVLTIRLKTIK